MADFVEETQNFDLTASFEHQWNRSGQPPDIASFLDEFPSASPRELADMLLLDMNRRAAAGKLIPIELYPCWGSVSADPELKWKIVEAAIVHMRASAQESPSPDWRSRYPEFADRIAALLNEESDQTPLDASFEETMVHSTSQLTVAEKSDDTLADRDSIGRYRVDSVLGKGGFGTVYRAWDADLERHVAIKVPRLDRADADGDDAEDFLREAKILASLDHPHIVPVHDVGRTDDGLCYIVWKFVDGEDLRQRMRREPLAHEDSVRIIGEVAAALHYAHRKGLVHRDIKPANILLDDAMQPVLIDFGLALRDQDPAADEGTIVGTPAYMSPEQIRAEGHLVDGRSDVFSLGVLLYELLTGRKPFTGKSALEVMDQVLRQDVRSLRQLNDAIPRELERVCLRALAKRARERYRTAAEFAEELFELQSHGPLSGAAALHAAGDSSRIVRSLSINRPVRIVPRGLQSYDADDAEFFLDLLPGTRSRDGLPEIIRFWKNWIEEPTDLETSRIGLIYGPSGCGKSSLVKAGLFPRISADVIKVHVEATPSGTEARLMNQLCRRCPELSVDTGLIQALASIRRNDVKLAGRKVVIVIDQFEQWLLQKTDFAATDLVRALRHCDGENVQCILMVRDDFWLSVSRLMLDLEIDLVPGRNTALVDLFDPPHARRILQSFGIAYDCLPENVKETSRPQEQFLDKSIQALTKDGKVVSVQLAIFAEMVKGKEWTPATLRALGGIEGIGVTFLEETFVSSGAPLEYRQHQAAARRVFAALLPQQETDLKGHLRSAEELQEISGYGGRDQDFRQLIRILESDLRVITPADPLGTREGDSESAASISVDQKSFQLTHDFLVPALRQWLTQKQKETFRGRTQLRFEEQADLWSSKPETRRLPSMLDWVRYFIWIRRGRSTDSQQEMMQAASRLHLRNGLLFIGLLVATIAVSVELYKHDRTDQFVEQLRTARIGRVPSIIEEFAQYAPRAAPQLRAIVEKSTESADQHLHASLALLEVDPGQAVPLARRLLDADPLRAEVLLESLAGHGDEIREFLWAALQDETLTTASRIRAAVALLTCGRPEPAEPDWSMHAPLFANLLVSAVAASDYEDERNRLLDIFRPMKMQLIDPLVNAFATDSEKQSQAAVHVLVDYASADPLLVARLILDADEKQLIHLMPLAEQLPDSGCAVLNQQLASDYPAADSVRQARRHVNAAIALVFAGQPESSGIWNCLRAHDDPTRRTLLIHQFRVQQIDAAVPAGRLLTEPRSDVRSALAQIMGEYPQSELEAALRARIVERLTQMMGNAADREEHASAEWALRQWNETSAIASGREKLRVASADRNARVTVSPSGRVMVTVDATNVASVGRIFQICSREVSQEDLTEMTGRRYYNRQLVESPECSASVVRFYEAIYFCQKLNIQEDIPESEWCFERITPEQVRNHSFDYRPDFSKTGYRLPTIAEWQYACNGDTVTPFHFGHGGELILKYAWMLENSGPAIHRSGLLKPNQFGLYDMLGNMREWCGEPVDKDGNAILIGGCWATEIDAAQTLVGPSPFAPNVNYDVNGLRVVRTVRPPAAADDL